MSIFVFVIIIIITIVFTLLLSSIKFQLYYSNENLEFVCHVLFMKFRLYPSKNRNWDSKTSHFNTKNIKSNQKWYHRLIKFYKDHSLTSIKKMVNLLFKISKKSISVLLKHIKFNKLNLYMAYSGKDAADSIKKVAIASSIIYPLFCNFVNSQPRLKEYFCRFDPLFSDDHSKLFIDAKFKIRLIFLVYVFLILFKGAYRFNSIKSSTFKKA